MAASPKTQKASGSGRKASSTTEKEKDTRKSASGSAQKASSSGRKTASGSAAKAGGSGRKSASGSAAKAGSSGRKSASGSAAKAGGSGRKSASGSAQKSSAASKRSATGSKPKTTGSKPKASSDSERQGTESKSAQGIYVYGVLPADIEMTSEMPGVGEPAGQVRIIRSDGLAALVSEVDPSQPLGSPEDLTAHKEIVDATAAVVPVLPARFGAVMDSEQAVTEELLAANHDEFQDALQELEGLAQYVVKGRYDEKAVLAEILAENRQAARLADKLRDADPDATRDARIKLGEIISAAVAAKRHRDTRALGNAMDGHCVASVVREPTHELDAVHVAFLVQTEEEGPLQQVLEELARDWEGLIEVRLLGPMAAYDFVGSVVPGGLR